MATIYLQDKRREVAQMIPKLQHAAAGIPLLITAIEHLREKADLPVAVMELMIAVIVLGTFVKEGRSALRHRRNPQVAGHSVLGWFDLAAAAMLFFEAFHGAHHKPGYLRPQFFTALAVLALGVFHSRIHRLGQKRRYLKLDEAGITYRPRRFWRWQVEWKDIRRIEMKSGQAVVHLTNGRSRTIDLARLHNSDAVRNALQHYAHFVVTA